MGLAFSLNTPSVFVIRVLLGIFESTFVSTPELHVIFIPHHRSSRARDPVCYRVSDMESMLHRENSALTRPVTIQWYLKEEQPWIQAIWFSMFGVANAIVSPSFPSSVGWVHSGGLHPTHAHKSNMTQVVEIGKMVRHPSLPLTLIVLSDRFRVLLRHRHSCRPARLAVDDCDYKLDFIRLFRYVRFSRAKTEP